MDNNSIPVFVYGTLKRGHGNYMRLLHGRAVFVATGAVKGDLFDLGPFPAMKEGDGTVHGEIFMVGPETLKDLDYLEGHPTFYKRTKMNLTQFGGSVAQTPVEVEAYVYQGDLTHQVVKKCTDGVWAKKSA